MRGTGEVSGSAVSIEKVDHEAPPVRAGLIEWLRPHETKALFVLGNLLSGFGGSHLYVARRGEQWLGIAGYYDCFKSASGFALEPEVMKALVRHVAERHSPMGNVNVVGELGQAAVGTMLEMGFEQANDPRQIFMERAIPAEGLPRVAHEEKVRGIEPKDAEQAAWLMRYLQRPGDMSPITEEEIERVMINPERLVLEAEGEVVATATTNGMCLTTFQILGVATHERHRRKGYARAVCAALIRRMQGKGARHVVLFTGPENVGAQACYRGLGFGVTGEYCLARFKK